MAQILPTRRHRLNLKLMNNYSGVTTTADVKPLSRCQLLLKLLPELALKPKWVAKAGAAFTGRKEWHCKSPDSPANCDLHWHLVHGALPAHPVGRCCILTSRGIGWKLAKKVMWVQKKQYLQNEFFSWMWIQMCWRPTSFRKEILVQCPSDCCWVWITQCLNCQSAVMG